MRVFNGLNVAGVMVAWFVRFRTFVARCSETGSGCRACYNSPCPAQYVSNRRDSFPSAASFDAGSCRDDLMRILLSNDDGYFAPGIGLLAETLGALGEVTVVAPERDRSGASNSLTLDRPLTVRRAPNGYFYVNGTPTDCVHLAVTGLLAQLPDIIISGINHGANMGDDTIYSGTVAAATEGFLLGIPSLAISLIAGGDGHFETAAEIAVTLVKRFRDYPVAAPILLNVNVPDVAFTALRGTVVTRLGKRHKAEPVVKSTTPRGEVVYWVGAAGAAQDAGEDTDFHATARQFVSVTPLQMDLTHYSQLDRVREWMDRTA